MSDFQRVTIEEVDAAYAFTGLKPVTGTFANITDYWCGCPAIAIGLYRARMSVREAARTVGLMGLMHDALPPPYLGAFVAGVDGLMKCPTGPIHGDEYAEQRRQGYEDGVAVHYHLWPNSPIPAP